MWCQGTETQPRGLEQNGGDALQTQSRGLPGREQVGDCYSFMSPLRCPVKSSFPERLGRDGTSLLSGLIAHVRCIYRSDCLCRAQQTNRLLFCQAPFVIGGGWEHFNAAIIWRPHLYCRAPTPRRTGRCLRDSEPRSGGRGQLAAARHCSSSPTSFQQAERSLLAPSRARRTHKANPWCDPESDHPPVACKSSCSLPGIWLWGAHAALHGKSPVCALVSRPSPWSAGDATQALRCFKRYLVNCFTCSCTRGQGVPESCSLPL